MRLSPVERWIAFWATALAALYVWFTFQPDLIFSSTTANGGDTGAHVWWPAYLRDHILPKWRLTGWAPDWYAGFPAGHFYFPLPALLIVFLDVFLPYNVAFKLVTVLGPVGLPPAAYVFARGIGARWPAPPLFAVATLPFLFYTGYTIYGGNLPSTLAGEFSFTIALALALCFLGTLARALDERQRLALPAALLAATAFSHIIVTVFAATGAVVIWMLRRPWRNLRPALAIGSVAFALTAIWSVPLVARLGYTTDMGWTKEPIMGPNRHLLPLDLRWAFLLAIVGAVTGLAFARRETIGLLALAAIFGVAFVVAPEGRLWNARLLPFYYLSVMFLAASGVAEMTAVVERVFSGVSRVGAFVTGRSRARPDDVALEPIDPSAPPTPAAESDASLAAPPPSSSPGDTAAGRHFDALAPLPPQPPVPAPAWRSGGPALAASLAVIVAAVTGGIWYTMETRAFIPSWIRWNYSGYEAKPAYPEFREVIQTMGELEPGRALWEPSGAIDKYGTTLALELLPHFTDGRIDSMEGLYFESSATTPYHFLMVAELAKEPSNPVRDLQYRTLSDFDLGVEHMRLFGVRWYMAQSDEAKVAADGHPGLRLVAETGSPEVTPHVARWRIYEVLDSPLVEPLVHEPVVLRGVEPGEWLEPSAAWFGDPGSLDRLLAADGPDAWARVDPEEAAAAPREPLPEVEVSDIRSGDDWVRFRVSRPGVPVLVKTSYFPNWKAHGARGPYRVTPNLMAVVPTGTEVSLHYGRTPVDLAGVALSVVGVAGLVLLSRWRLAPLPARRTGPGDLDGDGDGPETDPRQSEDEAASVLA